MLTDGIKQRTMSSDGSLRPSNQYAQSIAVLPLEARLESSQISPELCVPAVCRVRVKA